MGKISPFRAIKNLDLEIFEGEIIGLIGRNGSGKTTLLKSIFGELRPESGKIETDGRVILLSGVIQVLFHTYQGGERITIGKGIWHR